MNPPGRPLLTLLLLAGIIRALTLGAGWQGLAADPDAYVAISRTLATQGVFGLTAADGTASPTAFRPPLYPVVLAAISQAIIPLSGGFADPLAAEIPFPFSYRLGVAILHGVLGLATAAATYLAGRRLFRASFAAASDRRIEWAALVAALLVVVDPILLRYSAQVMTETLATALAALTLLVWSVLVGRLQAAAPGPSESGQNDPRLSELGPSDREEPRRRWAAAALALALLLALAYLCRPTFIVWTVLLGGYLAAWSARRRTLRPLVAAVVLGLVTALVVGGWMLRNQRHFGKPIWATTHGGYTLLLGNNPSFYHYLRHGSVGIAWDPEPFFARWQQRTLADPRQADFWDPAVDPPLDPDWQPQRPAAGDEVAEDRLAYETAVQAIRRDPAGFVRACLWRIGRLFSPLPQRAGGPLAAGILLVTLFYSGVGALVLLGLVRLGRALLHPAWAAPLALLLALVAVQAFYWTNLRMRAPLVPGLSLVAACGLIGRRGETAAAFVGEAGTDGEPLKKPAADRPVATAPACNNPANRR